MDMLVFLLGFLGFIIIAVMLIINLLRKKPKKKLGIGLLVCVFLMVIGLSMPSTESVNDDSVSASVENQNKEPVQENESEEITEDIEREAEEVVKEVEPEIKISAFDLYKEYKANEVAADNKYKKQNIEITGTVKDIGKDILDSIYITLDVGEYFDTVQCFFKDSESEEVAKLSKEQEVTISGRCEGLSITNVIIKNSKIK